MTEPTAPATAFKPKKSSPCRGLPLATRRYVPSGAPVTICITVATTFLIWPIAANSRKSPICWCMRPCRTSAAARLQGQAARLARAARRRSRRCWSNSCHCASNGCDAHRRIRARLRTPEALEHANAGARDIADQLMAILGSMLSTGITLQWRPAHRCARPTMTPSARISCICCTGACRRRTRIRAMHTSLILYAEHEFNASTFAARVIAGTGSDMYSAITGAIGALRGPKHGGANEVAFEIRSATAMRTMPKPTSAGVSRLKR